MKGRLRYIDLQRLSVPERSHTVTAKTMDASGKRTQAPQKTDKAQTTSFRRPRTVSGPYSLDHRRTPMPGVPARKLNMQSAGLLPALSETLSSPKQLGSEALRVEELVSARNSERGPAASSSSASGTVACEMKSAYLDVSSPPLSNLPQPLWYDGPTLGNQVRRA